VSWPLQRRRLAPSHPDTSVWACRGFTLDFSAVPDRD